MGPNILLYFVKYPTPGRVKTRLAKTLGNREAARLYRELAETNFREIVSLCQRNVCDLVVAFDPPQQRRDIQNWLPAPCAYRPQSEGGLSERLAGAFREAFCAASAAERVIALGSDTLGLTSEIIEEAFECLKFKDVVLGPAQDGGYYLIGSNSFRPELFEGIAWSTNAVLRQTRSRIGELGLSHQTLIQLEDLDEIKRREYEPVDD